MAGRTRIVLVGGGHAHALLLRAWRPRPDVALTLVSPAALTPYSGMLPGHVAGHYGWSDFHIDLAALARAAGAVLVEAHATGLDRAEGRVRLDRGAPLPFDFVSLDTGSTAGPPPLPGARAHVHPIKPLAPFLDAWKAFLATATDRARVAVLGGGVGGIELSLAMAHRLRAGGRALPFTLLEREAAIARELAPAARRRLKAALAAHGIEVRTRTTARAFEARGIATADGTVAADFIAAAVGARPAPWLAETGLALTPDGFVRVDATLRAVNEPRVFAVGDVAHLDHAPRPKAGVFAVRQGPVLHRALEAAVDGAEPPTYRPQTDYLRLISLGRRRAVAVKRGFVLGGLGPLGAGLWRLKDRIDRGFMRSLDA